MSQNKAEYAIHVDIPVALEKANVVFNMGHLVFAGDMPVGINYMRLLANRFREMNTAGQIVGVFHGDAAYITLNAELIKQGVQIEECAVSMEHHHWLNNDLLPGVKVHSGAIGRLIQLVQEGYVQIHP
jgi:intracellular sulfur oxidation DsrE/DsrF family protein